MSNPPPMEAFAIGWVPQGWARGDSLRATQPSSRDYGTIYRSFALKLDGPLDPRPVNGDDIAILTFTARQIDAVNRWLEWWREK